MSLANTSPVNVNRLFAVEQQLLRIAAHFDLKLRASSPELRPFLLTAPASHTDFLTGNLSNLAENLTYCMEKGIDPWDDTEFFAVSMRSLKLKFPNDFLDHIRTGDLIEGYDMNRRQIFRNMRFMEMSNYSLLEALSYEWPQLFDRATAITEKMISYCDEILWAANHTIPFGVPKHLIRELRTKERQFFEIEFKYISPLFAGPEQPAGLLGSFRCSPVALQDKADTLAFV